MKTKFTKGNWGVEINSTGSVVVTTDHGDYLDIGIATSSDYSSDDGCTNNQEARANAYLIAASKKMYAMLERLQLSVADEIERDELLKKARGE